jgi:uncharacterized protein YlxW (UPF0749 family)
VTDGPRPGAVGTRRRPDESMSLLNDLLSNPVDVDYAVAAERRRGGVPDQGPGGVLGLMAVLVVFGLLIVTMALETNRAQPAIEQERTQLIARINDESAEVERLRRTATGMERSVEQLENAVLSRSAAGQQLQARLERLGMAVGTVPVTGPGLVITVDDAPDADGDRAGQVLDTDLQELVNALWVAGAEAIAINDQRVTSRTAIRGAGSAITVNYRSLTRPYVIRAIGNPDTLPARLLETAGGRAWLDLQVNFGVKFATETGRDITVPARAPAPIRFASVPGGGR